MEHLLSALGNATLTTTIEIPSLVCDDFDGEFVTFPDRKGWDVSSWQWPDDTTGFDRNGKTVSEMASFLQSWLFFGILKTVLDVEHPEELYTRQDASGVRVLTTERLLKHVGVLRSQHASLHSDDQEDWLDARHASLSASGTVCEALSYHLTYEDFEEDMTPLLQTLFAAHLLCDTLKDVNYQLRFGMASRGSPKPDPFLRDQFLKHKWCVATVEYVQKTIPFALQALALVLGSERTRDDHRMCTPPGCMRNQVRPGYRPMHVTSDCCCELIQVPVDEVISMLEEGLIPIVGINVPAERSAEVKLRVHGVDFDGADVKKYGGPYVAITHVWSDGLGNPDDNSLPACQLTRLAASLEALKGSYASIIATDGFDLPEVPIWFDTLCIPVSPEHQALRDFSISKMNQIYREAAGVLVLDKDIQKLPKEASMLEVLVHLLCSGWRSRLWTFQEGTLARELHLPIKGRCVTLGGMDDDDTSDDEPACLIQHQLNQMAWLTCYRFVWNTLVKAKDETRPGQHLELLVNAACHRSTSRGGDETICIATFLGLDPAPLLSQPVEDRMVTLMKMLPTVSPILLLTRGPRIGQHGFRWAPRSLLNPFGLQDFQSFRLERRYTDESDVQHLIPPPYFCSVSSGLNVFFSALRFERPKSEDSEVLAVKVDDDETYLIQHVDSGSGIDWAPLSTESNSEQLAILLTDLEHGSMCLMISINSEAEDRACGLWRSLVLVNRIGDFFEDSSIGVAMQHCYEGERLPHRWWKLE